MKMRCKSQAGFTLVELVLVILIMGIIAAASTQFIVNSVRGYSDVSQRAVLADDLRLAAQKLEYQLTRALASSVRVSDSGRCLELIPVRARSALLDDTGRVTLQVVPLDNVVLGSRVLSSRAPVSAYSGGARVVQQDDEPAHSRLTLSADVDLGGAGALLAFTGSAESYCLDNGALWRYRDYGLRKLQPSMANLPRNEPKRVLFAQQLTAYSRFSLNRARSQLTLKLEVRDGERNESIRIEQPVVLTREEGL